jgi:DNA-binding NarL/FixJ family response regulator
MSERLRVLLADDHPVFRDGLRALIGSVGDAEVAGEAATGAEAVECALELQPDVVVMDLHLPELSGIEATRRVVEASPHVGVLVLTMVEDDDAVFAAMRAGALGYWVKGSTQAEILHAIRAVGAGEAVFGPAIARRLIEYFSSPPSGSPQAFPDLTAREREVLELIARGDSNAAIARRLVISQKTVRNHVSNIFTKLRVADRSQAIVKAREAGIGLDPGALPHPLRPSV